MVRPMRTAVVTVALLGLGIASGATEAAERCLTRSEARALYRTSYLYWRGQGGKRCWTSSRRGGRAEPHRPSRQAVVVPRLPPPPPLILPAGLMPPLLAEVESRSILDSPRWAWIADARAAAHDDDLPYSSFAPGTEPDTWPRLPEPANAAGMVVVVMSGLLAMAFGLGLWRWRLGRVRLT
jgi:hypothetical protein